MIKNTIKFYINFRILNPSLSGYHGVFHQPLILAKINPKTAKLHDLNFHPLKVVSRYRDTQL